MMSHLKMNIAQFTNFLTDKSKLDFVAVILIILQKSIKPLQLVFAGVF
jgi:hypothetical protein